MGLDTCHRCGHSTQQKTINRKDLKLEKPESDLESIKKVVKESLGKIADSAVWVGIVPDNFIENPRFLMQFALSVLLDKPLFLIIQRGVNPGKNLIRILAGYEFYTAGDEDSIKQATKRLSEKIAKKIDGA